MWHDFGPKSFVDADALLGGAPAKALTKKVTLERRPGRIAVVIAGEEMIAFFPDARIKVCTWGINTSMRIKEINAFLPFPYRVRVREGVPHVRLIDRRTKPSHVLARFLSSTTFTPSAAIPVASEETCNPL